MLAAEFRRLKVGPSLFAFVACSWEDFGGAPQYVRWAQDRGWKVGRTEDFYVNPVCKKWFKYYIKSITNRVNTYTGIRYKDDPAIFGYAEITRHYTRHDQCKHVHYSSGDIVPWEAARAKVQAPHLIIFQSFNLF